MICHFHDTSAFSKMRLPCALDDNRRLRADGSNLPAFLYLLKEKHPTAYSLIRRTVQRVAPFFDDFVLAPSALHPDKIKLEWQHRDQDQYFDAWTLSDGTLRFIALATLFLQPAALKPPLVLVDEPELGLHPFAITLLGAMVKSASVDMQVILATQSPLVLDEFPPQDVLVAERDGHATTFRRLDADSLETWLEDYSLGELWEKNHLGGRPAAWLRLIVQVEGVTEEEFVNELLAPHLLACGWHAVVAIRMGRARSPQPSAWREGLGCGAAVHCEASQRGCGLLCDHAGGLLRVARHRPQSVAGADRRGQAASG